MLCWVLLSVIFASDPVLAGGLPAPDNANKVAVDPLAPAGASPKNSGTAQSPVRSPLDHPVATSPFVNTTAGTFSRALSGAAPTGTKSKSPTTQPPQPAAQSPGLDKPDLNPVPTVKSPPVSPPTNASSGPLLEGAKLGGSSLGAGISRPSVEIFQQAQFSVELGAVQAAGGAIQVAEAAKELEGNPSADVDGQLDRGFANIAQGNAAIEMGRKLYGQAKKVSVDEAKLASVRGKASPVALPSLELDPAKLGEKSRSVLDDYEVKTGLNKDDLVKEINGGGSPYDVFAMIKNFPVGSGELRDVSESASQKLGSSGYVQVTGTYSLADLVSEQNLKTKEFTFGSAPAEALVAEAKPAESMISGGEGSRNIANTAGTPEEQKRALAEEREAFLSAAGTDIFRPQATAEEPEPAPSLFERVRGKLKSFSRNL